MHFFDIHFLEERGTFAFSEKAVAEMDLAVRFAVMLGSRIFLPAASYYENALAAKILRPFLDSEVSDLFTFVGGGSSLDEFRLGKIEQYRQGSAQYDAYSRETEQLIGWTKRQRSATKDIARSWLDTPPHDDAYDFLRPHLGSETTSAHLERLWQEVPEKLGREAFIVEHVIPMLPVDGRNLAVKNFFHGRINAFYFESYTKDFSAAVFQNMNLSGGISIPSGAPSDDIDFLALLKMSRTSGLLQRIRDCDISRLESITFDPAFQEVFAMSQTDGAAERIIKDAEVCDLAILTALPKEREAVEVVFGKGKTLEVDGDPQLYKEIFVQIAGKRKRVILAVLPTMGNARAGVTAANFFRSFKTKHAFMVGIAGGAPLPGTPLEHVRLGDVVIGQSVFEWDHVKRTAGGEVTYRDSDQRLSQKIFQLVANFKSEKTSFDSDWLAFRERALTEFGLDLSNLPPDILHAADDSLLQHPDDARRKLVPSIVHFGKIGSGDTLLKDPVIRDELREKHGVLAVEMESVGLRDAGWAHGAEVAVVRGIVDYCDAHKDDRWHMIGALSAAAMTRFLYEKIVEAEPR
ncbi:hypothetical protein IB277_14595 [Ensifer sp. ENS07]|uniref:phosphorylase family protein n=1 Tax=unclassified Ensifer TaxID=2633371 RepID=UPI00177C11F1|nr:MULTISPECIES: hypothetical protein [unclassified Ensifer]MBD9507970.1 hypothetical protein [Ensifer sp. ENS10]MBD9637533.1 hypothetical protein [Ensifer sp. ENS07]